MLYAIYSKQAWLLSMMDSRSDVPKELLASVRKLVGDFRNELEEFPFYISGKQEEWL